MNTSEVWIPVPGYEDSYSVSNLGRVMRTRAENNTHAGRILSLWTSQSGYQYAALSKNGKMKHHRVHRLVLAAFVGECPADYVVNHKDGDKLNNCSDNLEYVTLSQNERHAYRVLHKSEKISRGEKHYRTSLTAEKVIEIKRYLINRSMTYRAIGRLTGVSEKIVGQISRGESWSHITIDAHNEPL